MEMTNDDGPVVKSLRMTNDKQHMEKYENDCGKTAHKITFE